MNQAMRRLAFGAIVGMVQSVAAVTIHLAWQRTAGEWGHTAWLAYLIGFPVAAPAVGIGLGVLACGVPATLPRQVAAWGAVAVLSAAFIVLAHGLEDAGLPFWAYTLAFGISVAIAGFVACVRDAGRAGDGAAVGAKVR